VVGGEQALQLLWRGGLEAYSKVQIEVGKPPA
jgi:hypothetical protein